MERHEAPSVSQTSLGRQDDRWRVFSGLEDEEEDEDEEVEDGVKEEEETTLDGSTASLDAQSVATETCARGKRSLNNSCYKNKQF